MPLLDDALEDSLTVYLHLCPAALVEMYTDAHILRICRSARCIGRIRLSGCVDRSGLLCLGLRSCRLLAWCIDGRNKCSAATNKYSEYNYAEGEFTEDTCIGRSPSADGDLRERRISDAAELDAARCGDRCRGGRHRCGRTAILLRELLDKLLHIQPQKSRIVAHESFGIDHPWQFADIALLNVFDVESANARPFLNVGNRQSLFLAFPAQDVSYHETTSQTFVTSGII